MNTTLNEGFKQVCVWPATIVGQTKIEDFEACMRDTFNTRVQYLEEVLTAPDFSNGFPIEGTGDRNDVFFAVHNDDVMRFSIVRLSYGIRWIEDVYSNEQDAIYPERIQGYKCWDTNEA